jgi:hypothetical protein
MALTKVSYSMITGAVYNALDYGADNTGATDSASAIQTAINEAATAGGGTVFLPAGTYRTNTSLILKDRVTLQGEGVPSRTDVATSPTRVLHYGDNPCLFAQAPTLIGEFSLQNIEFDGTVEVRRGDLEYDYVETITDPFSKTSNKQMVRLISRNPRSGEAVSTGRIVKKIGKL